MSLEYRKDAGEAWKAKEVAAGPGGSTAGAARVLGPFQFAFDDAGIEDGIEVWTPAAGDILLDAWIEVDENFTGTTPLGDIGTFTGGQAFGWLASNNAAADLTVNDVNNTGIDPALLTQGGGPVTGVYQVTAVSATYNSVRQLPAKFIGATPVKVVVSQNGEVGGAAVGGSAGSGSVYLVVATPSLT